MDAGPTLRDARNRAGITQGELARRAGTSQAAISAYESGSKEPSLATFGRLLAATGARLTVEHGRRPVTEPSRAQLARSGQTLARVLELAEALPVRHRPLARPNLGNARSRAA